jgi:hypothetical protein
MVAFLGSGDFRPMVGREWRLVNRCAAVAMSVGLTYLSDHGRRACYSRLNG